MPPPQPPANGLGYIVPLLVCYFDKFLIFPSIKLCADVVCVVYRCQDYEFATLSSKVPGLYFDGS